MKFRNIFNSPIKIISIVLLSVLSLLIIVDIVILNRKLDEYISGVSTNIVGIIITVVFVQLLFNNKIKSDQKFDEFKKIIRSDKVIQLIMNRYVVFLHCMIHDHKEINLIQPSLEIDFKISSMKFLHDKCFIMKYEFNRTSVSLFYEVELELRNIFISMIQNIDYNFFHEISNLLLEYINISYQYDSRGEILNNENMFAYSNKNTRVPITKNIKEALENSAEEYMNNLLCGKVNYSNLMFSYVNLYLMINKQKEILLKYKNYIINIKKEYNKQNVA